MKITFEDYCQEIYQDKWKDLKAALLQEKKHFQLKNPFENLEKEYYLDEASLLPSAFLDLKPEQKILDMCAAPGGKSLSILFKLKGNCFLTCNDRSSERRARLRRVIDSYIPAPIKEKINFTSHDATKWGLYEQNTYDRIILDAPCSSERHVIEKPSEVEKWSIKRPKSLAVIQFAMLAAALEAVKPEGLIAYSTCSINPMENDGVIEKLFKKRKDLFEVVDIHHEIAVKTKYGLQVLPNQYGHGPFYLSIVKKL